MINETSVLQLAVTSTTDRFKHTGVAIQLPGTCDHVLSSSPCHLSQQRTLQPMFKDLLSIPVPTDSQDLVKKISISNRKNMVATTLGKFRPNSNKFGVYWYQSVNILMYMRKPFSKRQRREAALVSCWNCQGTSPKESQERLGACKSSPECTLINNLNISNTFPRTCPEKPQKNHEKWYNPGEKSRPST